jgi:hypothetical protein
MDETSWKIAYPGVFTWAKRGAKEVKVRINYNQKQNVTAIATITADPELKKLPLTIIASGKTKECEKQLGSHPDYSFNVLHSSSGWSQAATMISYLKNLRSYYDGEFAENENYNNSDKKIHLIWDIFAAHRDESVRACAEKNNIILYFIPAGCTDALQPLDIKVFGALKAKARKLWNENYIFNPEEKPSKATAVGVLLQTWESITYEVIKSGWLLYLQENTTSNAEIDLNPNDLIPRNSDIMTIIFGIITNEDSDDSSDSDFDPTLNKSEDSEDETDIEIDEKEEDNIPDLSEPDPTYSRDLIQKNMKKMPDFSDIISQKPHVARAIADNSTKNDFPKTFIPTR